VGLLWSDAPRPCLLRIFLPGEEAPSLSGDSFPQATRGDHPFLLKIRRWLDDYDQGRSPALDLDELLRGVGSPFRRRAWAAAAALSPGKVRTYGQLARDIGAPGAARAVGTAMAQNPFPLLIPCHRIVKANGAIGEYSAGGPARKRFLLAREGVVFDAQGRVCLASQGISEARSQNKKTSASQF